MTGLAHSEAWHVAECRRCGWKGDVAMRLCSVERLPWRLRWRCPSCDVVNGTRLSERTAREIIKMFEQPYGTLIAQREITDFLIEARNIDERVRVELLDS